MERHGIRTSHCGCCSWYCSWILFVPAVTRAGCLAVSICPFTHIQNRRTNVSHTLGPPNHRILHLECTCWPLESKVESTGDRQSLEPGCYLVTGAWLSERLALAGCWAVTAMSRCPLPGIGLFLFLLLLSPGLIALPNWKLPLWKSSHEGQDAWKDLCSRKYIHRAVNEASQSPVHSSVKYSVEKNFICIGLPSTLLFLQAPI